MSTQVKKLQRMIECELFNKGVLHKKIALALVLKELGVINIVEFGVRIIEAFGTLDGIDYIEDAIISGIAIRKGENLFISKEGSDLCSSLNYLESVGIGAAVDNLFIKPTIGTCGACSKFHSLDFTRCPRKGATHKNQVEC